MSAVVARCIGRGGFRPLLSSRASGSGTETVPAGATNVVIEVWGGGGKGGLNSGAGAGGYCRTSIACSSGQTLNYSVGAGSTTSGVAGAASTVTSGTLSVTSMTGNGGNPGSGATGGTGGTASGGTAANTTGTAGQSSGGGATGGPGTAGVNAGPAGAGGDQTLNGSNGLIAFYYT